MDEKTYLQVLISSDEERAVFTDALNNRIPKQTMLRVIEKIDALPPLLLPFR